MISRIINHQKILNSQSKMYFELQNYTKNVKHFLYVIDII